MSRRLKQIDLFDDQVVIPSLKIQAGGTLNGPEKTYFSAPEIDVDVYDKIILTLSGKDSVATLLHLIEIGADMSRVELWHHDVDGNGASELMDWPFMKSYIETIGEAFQLPVYFSWLEGGIEGEMLKENAPSKPHWIETPDGLITLGRDQSRIGTRRKFPQMSGNLQTRWCSSAAKIDVARRALNNQSRFLGSKTLFISGERREESSNRARYNQFEPHSCDRRSGRLGRHVDSWRPVLHWSEEEVWAIHERHRVLPGVPYRLGWSRSSCMKCIFNSPRIWSTIAHYWPDTIKPIADYEREFGVTISRKGQNVLELAASTRPVQIDDLEALQQASLDTYELGIFVPEGEIWTLPSGAYGQESCGSF